MSILGSQSTSSSTTAPSLNDIKTHASFFFRDTLRSARLALTDVTPVELLTEEVTNGESCAAPDARSMRIISKAAFEVDDYYRIVAILHKRLSRFDRKTWRQSYRALVLLEHLLTHGPESGFKEFQTDKEVIREFHTFQHIDERGFNWGATARKKAERVLNLLEDADLHKEEREQARKLIRGIQGFGSFAQRSTNLSSIDDDKDSIALFGRCNSQYNNDHEEQSDSPSSSEGSSAESSKSRSSSEFSIASDSSSSSNAKITEIRSLKLDEVQAEEMKELINRDEEKDNFVERKCEMNKNLVESDLEDEWDAARESEPLLCNV